MNDEIRKGRTLRLAEKRYRAQRDAAWLLLKSQLLLRTELGLYGSFIVRVDDDGPAWVRLERCRDAMEFLLTPTEAITLRDFLNRHFPPPTKRTTRKRTQKRSTQ